MKITNVFSLLALAAPVAINAGGLKGVKYDKPASRALKGGTATTAPTIPGNLGSIGSSLSGLTSACFSKVSTVQVEGKGPVMMKDLQVGQKVLTGSNNYQPVYAFGHNKADERAEFVKLHTAETSLEMTGQHLVFLDGKSNPVRADSVKVGDVLKGSSAVTKVSTIVREGIYAPFTAEGTVVVDGVVASSYISLQENAKEYVELQGGIATMFSQHDYVHLGLSPFRLMCMGISSSFCSDYNEDGIPSYPAFAIRLNEWAHSQNVVVQSLVLLAVLLLTGVCMLLENTFGATWAPVVVFALGAAATLTKASGVSFRANKVKTV